MKNALDLNEPGVGVDPEGSKSVAQGLLDHPIVATAKQLHAQARDSWDALETGIDFGFVLLLCLASVILCLLWSVVTKATDAATRGAAAGVEL